MKIKEVRQLSDDDLIQKEKALIKELADCNYQRAAGQVEKPHKFQLLRKGIARILTVVNERRKDGNKAK